MRTCMRMRKRSAGGPPWPPPRLADIPARMNAGPHLDPPPPTPLQLAPEFLGAQRLQRAHIALIFPDSTRRAVPQLRQCAPALPSLQPPRSPPHVVTMRVGARYEIVCGWEPGARARAVLPRRRAGAGVRGEGGGVCAWVDMRARAVHTCGLTPIQPDPASRPRSCSRISNAGVLAILAALNDLRLDACTRGTTSLRAQQPVVVCVWG
ncbi:hypothetical protein DFH08DRAFT_280663 [Mycena albidolilacea]|uniref:Uncharacterized protein n=1 Tax=Mycena albidolilacea TaxID=1033008 RepID=A0AAD7ELA2_9AGAR|nr:hypothetical protein DFH08DRAFT_280663 [Mycena albidolilacea]